MRPRSFSAFLLLALLAALLCLAPATALASAASEVNKGLDAHREGELGLAMRLYDRAINSGELPLVALSMAYNNRGALWADLGHLKKALNDFGLALELDSTNPLFYTNRGLVYQRWGKYKDALDDYNRALDLDDGFANALVAKAWLLATCPVAALRNGPQAVELAGRAAGGERTANILDTLAAALAEDKKFPAAVRMQRRAILLVRDSDGEKGDPPEAMERRLRLYEKKQPYREAARPPKPVTPEYD
ncbi:MAG: hypothetical protein KQH53_17885 [Desulfarculaceae bacterium]|nr:hypothetical protein [Desulfarculaceae bacterium]